MQSKNYSIRHKVINQTEYYIIMKILIKPFLFILFICSLSGFSLFGQTQSGPFSRGNVDHKITADAKGFDIIFLVDMSAAGKTYSSLVKKFINSACDTINTNFPKTKKNNYHLITLPQTPGAFKTRNILKEDILKAVMNRKRRSSIRIDLKSGLNSVFDLFEDGFLPNTGIVFFISNGNNKKTNLARTKKDFKSTIDALKRSGITVFSIYLSAGIMKCEECMIMVSEHAGTPFHKIEKEADIPNTVNKLTGEVLKTDYSSPVEWENFKNEEKKWNDQLEQSRKESKRSKQENIRIREDIKTRDSLIEAIEKSEKEMIDVAEKQKTKTDILLVLLIALLGLVTFLQRDHLTFLQFKRQLLWGKLVISELGKPKDTVIDLSTRVKGDIIKTPGVVPDFRLSRRSHYGRKVICTEVKKGYIEYYKYGNGKPDKTDQYLGDQSKFIRISNLYGNHHCEYMYQFLEILEKSCLEPAPIDLLFGREEKIDEIVNNFLEEKKRNCYNMVLSGMGYAGKTSLLRTLKIYFEKDFLLRKKCVLEHIEYDPTEKLNIKQFKENFKLKITKLSKHKRKRKILMVDNYDDLLTREDKALSGLIQKCGSQYDIYLVLSGKMPADLIYERYSDYLPQHYNEIVLDEIGNPADLIDAMLDEIGFPGEFVKTEVKTHIAHYASNIPYFCKMVLKELLKTWLENDKKNTLTVPDVEEAAEKVADNERTYYLKNIVPSYDKADENKRDKVRLQDIMTIVSRFKGSVGFEEIERRLTNDEDENYRKKKKKSFREKLQQLIKLGLLKEESGYLIGVPYLFHFRGDREVKGESTDTKTKNTKAINTGYTE